LGKWGSALGKQNLRVTCPTGKVEFKYFSNPASAAPLKFPEYTIIEGFHAKRAYIAFWADFYFLQD